MMTMLRSVDALGMQPWHVASDRCLRGKAVRK